MTDDDAGEADGPGALTADDLADDQADPFEASDTDETPPDAGVDAEEDVGENIFGGPLDRGPITAGRPEAENVLFVLVGILTGALVVLRLMGAI